MSEYQNKVAAPSSLASRPLAWWVPTAVLVGALLMAIGGVIALINPAMLVSPGADINGATHVYAGYLVSRNLALAGLLVVALAIRARRVLGSLMVLIAIIQVLDAGMDMLEGRWALVPGVVVFALIFFIAAGRVSGHLFWKPAAWRDA